MVKKILAFFSLIFMAALYALNIKSTTKKPSEDMRKTIINDISKLSDADKYSVARSIDSKLNG